MLDKSGPYPLYIQVQDWIRGKVSGGEWGPKFKLPSEVDLANSLGVSRGTLKQAISSLVNQGVLIQIHGKGTFVVGDQIEQPLAEKLISTAEALSLSGKEFVTKVLYLGTVVPTKEIGRLLQIEEGGKGYQLIRLRYIDDVPVALLENYLPHQLFPNLEQYDFEKSTLFSVVENDYGISINWGKRSFMARGCERSVAHILDVAEGTPIIFLEQSLFDTNDNSIEHSRIWIRSDQIKLTSTLKRY